MSFLPIIRKTLIFYPLLFIFIGMLEKFFNSWINGPDLKITECWEIQDSLFGWSLVLVLRRRDWVDMHCKDIAVATPKIPSDTQVETTWLGFIHSIFIHSVEAFETKERNFSIDWYTIDFICLAFLLIYK